VSTREDTRKRCGATRTNGQPCKGRAVDGHNLCPAHKSMREEQEWERIPWDRWPWWRRVVWLIHNNEGREFCGCCESREITAAERDFCYSIERRRAELNSWEVERLFDLFAEINGAWFTAAVAHGDLDEAKEHLDKIFEWWERARQETTT
jgi:hypothetical protein